MGQFRLPRGAGRGVLLTAIQRVIAEDGIGALRVRAVSAAAGMSIGSTTYHFTDREEMIDNGLTAVTTAAVADIAAGPANDAHTALSAIATPRERALVLAEMRLHATRSPHAAALVHQLDAALHEVLSGAGYSDTTAHSVVQRMAGAVADTAAHHPNSADYSTVITTLITEIFATHHQAHTQPGETGGAHHAPA